MKHEIKTGLWRSTDGYYRIWFMIDGERYVLDREKKSLISDFFPKRNFRDRMERKREGLEYRLKNLLR